MFSEVSAQNARIKLEVRRLKSILNEQNVGLYRILEAYFDEYCSFDNITPLYVSELLDRLGEEYSSDLKIFQKTGLYPCMHAGSRNLSRTDYDIFMLASCLYTKHRFSLITTVNTELKKIHNFAKTAIIGGGNGLETLLLENKKCLIYSYDLAFSTFCRQRFPEVVYQTSPFAASGDKYNLIWAIEVMEHIQEPFKLLRYISDSLEDNGSAFLTIAVNIPQFDHLHNFAKDDFEQQLSSYSLSIVNHKEIPHNYLLHKVEAFTIFYHLRKTS